MISVVNEEVGRSVRGWTGSLGCTSYVQAGFLQILQKAAISVRICSADTEEVPRSRRNDNERKSLLFIAKIGTNRLLETTAEKR